MRIVRYISSNGSRLMEMANSLDFLKEYDVLEHFILWWWPFASGTRHLVAMENRTFCPCVYVACT